MYFLHQIKRTLRTELKMDVIVNFAHMYDWISVIGNVSCFHDDDQELAIKENQKAKTGEKKEISTKKRK